MKNKLDLKLVKSNLNEDSIKNCVENLEMDLKQEAELFKLQMQLEEANKLLKSTNESLKRSLFNFNALFENSGQAHLVINNQFQIINFNKTANNNCNLFLKKNLSAGTSITHYIYPEDRPKFYEYLELAFKGQVINSEFSIDNDKSENFWFQINIAPIQNEDNFIKEVIISINNISVHANRSISILESINDGMFALDESWQFTYVNAKAEKMIKRKREDLLGKNIWQEFKMGPQNSFYRHYHKAVKEKTDVHFEEHSYFMGGWLEVHGYPSKDGISVYFRSINERKEAEEKQKESEEWFKAVLATSRDGFAVEVNEKLIYMNDAYLELFGYDRSDSESLKNIHVSTFYADESKKAMLELSEKRVTGEAVPSIYETKGKRKDGTIISLEISASVLNMKNQKYVIVLVRDITQRKEAELKLIEQNEELMKINSELDRFVYSASHDLRAPLMSILGLINIAKIETKESSNLEYLDLMTKSISKLDKFVQDIIDYSRNSRLVVKREEIDFKLLLEEHLEGVKFLDHADKIEKIIEIRQGGAFFNDRNRVSVILNNIISNAIRYCNLSQVNPYLKITVITDAEKAIVEIEDNGQGIASQHVDRIFEMFYRASETNVGSGLGLYIVKETILKLEGEVKVASTYGEGTKFTIQLPNLLSASSSES